MIAVEPRHRLDAGVRDLAAGAAGCLSVRDRDREERRLLTTWGCADGLAFLSVRSAFDTLLTAMALPAGSEVAFSAVTHPDMPRIARAHGLRVVPLDLDPATLAPTPAACRDRIGARTRLVVVAHLFGARIDLDDVIERAVAVGAPVVEDCAQVIRGAADHGDPRTAVSLFSFGAIKTATAFGGALARVSDPMLRARMYELDAVRPIQTSRAQLARLAKFSVLLGLGKPGPYGVLVRSLDLIGRDRDAFVNGLVKAFPAATRTGERAVDAEAARTAALLARIRRRPSAPLLALVRRRLERFDEQRLSGRARLGEEISASLPAPLSHPGHDCAVRLHWVVPVSTPEPDQLVRALREAGLDAARGTSSIEAVAPEWDSPELEPIAALALMRSIVFVPASCEMTRPRRERLVSILRLASHDLREAPEPKDVLA